VTNARMKRLERLWTEKTNAASPTQLTCPGGADLTTSFFVAIRGGCDSMEGMRWRLCVPYPGVIYHLMARGNGRQEIVRDSADHRRLQDHHGKAAITSDHLHIVLKPPEPNLVRGVQTFLSGYANAWTRRHRFSGHVFLGRYRTELVDDETYLWPVTRYVHPNPVRAGSVDHGWILGSEGFIDRLRAMVRGGPVIPHLNWGQATISHKKHDMTQKTATSDDLIFCSVDQGIFGHLTRRNLAALAVERGDYAGARRLWAEVLAECPGDREALAKLERFVPVG
jgi:REP element-mobilizing transposase RayT